MSTSLAQRFETYAQAIVGALGHADRHQPAQWYLQGLMLPGERKSVEPMAARVCPGNVRSAHQSMHHLVATAEWDDAAVLAAVATQVVPTLLQEATAWWWILDDTAHVKYGQHSVGVARQYCGRLGKTENCQVAVSLSLATATGSLPLAYQLYLPEAWTDDRPRCERAGVPPRVGFQTKGQIARAQIAAALEQGIPPGIILGDAAYGDETALRSRFARVRVRAAHRQQARAEEWLLLEWPAGEAAPTHYWLATLPATVPFRELVAHAKGRWMIERDYQELKSELGLSHYEGRNWRGFHHHATLCIAAYGFLMLERLRQKKKRRPRLRAPPVPPGFRPRGAGPAPAARPLVDRDRPVSAGPRPGPRPAAVPLLRRPTARKS
jgi:SRSO17 transposase